MLKQSLMPAISIIQEIFLEENETMRKTTQILSVEKNDFKKELEFEVTFLLSLTEKQRCAMMKKLAKQSRLALKNNVNSKTPVIISRP
jgi:hypothetical protein